MKVAVVQPYFFPYVGYIQLIKEADIFVVFDDVNFITKGWIKRNRILAQGNTTQITLPIKNASQNKKINELEHALDNKAKCKLLSLISHSYKKAPFYDKTFDLIQRCLNCEDKNLATFLTYSLIELSGFLDLQTKFVMSSSINSPSDFDSAQRRIIDIVKVLNGTEYINLPGGKTLYQQEAFETEALALHFIEPELSPYPQLNTPDFIPGLSVIDMMMNTDTNALLTHQIAQADLLLAD
ncbi:MAG: WbqC family protein [Pseudomonadota bacterium]